MRPTHNKVIFFFLVLALIFIFFYAHSIQAAFLQLFRGVNINRGLIGYWSFNNIDIQGTTVFDGSGNKRNGTLTNGPTTGISGQFGSAINFDGSNDYIDISPVPTVTGNASISFWMNADAISSTLVNLYFVNSGSEDADDFVIGTFQSKIMATADNNSSFSAQSSALSSATWYHVVVTKTAGDITDVYINGVKDTNASSNFWGGATARGIIGGTWNGGSIGAPWKGKLDEVRVYNRILSSSEVKYLYDRDPIGAAYQSKAIIPNNNGLLAYWNFDDCDTCTRALDMSGNHKDLTMYTTCATAAGDLHTSLGKINRGASFDASNDCLDNATNIPIVTGNASVSLWFYAKTVTGQRELFNIVNSGSENVDYFNVGTHQSRILACGDNEDADCNSSVSSPTLTPNRWYHLVVTKTTGNISSIYLNGVDGATTATGNLDGGTAATRIGNGFFASQSWDGYIDEIRIYNKVLTAAEVQTLFKETRRFYVNGSQNDKFTNGLVGMWSFNGPDMSTGAILDASGNGNTGYVFGTPATTTHRVAGMVGQAIKLSDSAVSSSANGDSINTTLSIDSYANLTLTAWVNIAKGGAGSFGLSHIVSNDNGGWDRTLTTDSDTFLVGTGSASADTAIAFNINTWDHVAVVYDDTGNNIYFYLNGAQRWSNGSRASGYSGTTLQIGRSLFNSGGSYYTGLIDEVRAYSRALSSAEVFEIYKSARR